MWSTSPRGPALALLGVAMLVGCQPARPRTPEPPPRPPVNGTDAATVVPPGAPGAGPQDSAGGARPAPSRGRTSA
jgi:hypothetical protein